MLDAQSKAKKNFEAEEAVVGFDAKEFIRSKSVYLPGSEEGLKKQREIRFYTPLGIGVRVSKPQEFREAWLKESARLALDFNIHQKRPLYSSHELKEQLLLRRAIPFCDQLVQSVQSLVDSIFVTYVILPPEKIPTVKVGGYKCPEIDVPTQAFLRNLGPMFSYITAWSYFGIPRGEAGIHVDGFNSKWTPAWSDLCKQPIPPKVFPHGDECNPFVNAADLFAFLTDAKLYTSKLKLLPPDVEKIWSNYKFKVEVHFLDDKVLSKYSWKTEDHIDVTEYLARPMTFLLIDQIEKLALAAPTEAPLEEQPKFRDLVRKLEPYVAALTYALQKGGGIQSYGGTVDAAKVRDGDTLVYIGTDSKKAAYALADMCDVVVVSGKEMRKMVLKK